MGLARAHAAWLSAVVALASAVGLPAGAQGGCSAVVPATALRLAGDLRSRGAACGSRGRFAPSGALAWSAALEALAQQQAQWVAEYGLLIHTGRGGETIGERAGAAGYRFARIAENLAQGQPSLAAVLDAWTASDGHCVNLHDAEVNEMALACVPGADGRPVWVLVLGRRL